MWSAGLDISAIIPNQARRKEAERQKSSLHLFRLVRLFGGFAAVEDGTYKNKMPVLKESLAIAQSFTRTWKTHSTASLFVTSRRQTAGPESSHVVLSRYRGERELSSPST